MKKLTELLQGNPLVSDYKINVTRKESYELFFVKGALETVRCTENTDKEVTVYSDHGEFRGDSQFFIYPSTTEAELREHIETAARRAMLINNRHFTLPGAQTGEYAVQSNFPEHEPQELAARIANIVFAANTLENASLNSVEIFVNKLTQQVINSRGLHKTQVRYNAMVEAIPTYNGSEQSVELYEQYNFSSLDEQVLLGEIAGKIAEVKARYEAKKPERPLSCPVILGAEELAQLSWNIASQLNYSTVYSHSNLYNVGDAIQSEPQGDGLTITMAGQVPGSTRSSCFDGDGLSLTEKRVLEGGRAAALYGGSRYGQYLGETPTGEFPCLILEPGTAKEADFQVPSLELVSMSGLQVDFYSDYIGGEVRLAYYRDQEGKVTPLTGISVSGKLSEVLNSLRLSEKAAIQGGYQGPEKALVCGMQIF